MHIPETLSICSSSTHREMSNDYETPATSVAVTPSELAVNAPGKVSSTRRRPFEETAAGNAFGSPIESSNRKRKRANLDCDLEGDRRMAEALQAEEYGEVPFTNNTMPHGKVRILDSDEEEMSLTEPPSDPDVDFWNEEDSITNDRRVVKNIKTQGTSLLPTRKARDNARTSIAQKASLGIMDSDDEEESEYLSEADSDILSDAETLDSIVNGDDVGGAVAVTAASETLPAASTSTTRRRVATAARRGRALRWEDKVISHAATNISILLILI